ncbi:MAG: hypothetical protein OHK0012_19040 [Synechococcales cyanobacterium]
MRNQLAIGLALGMASLTLGACGSSTGLAPNPTPTVTLVNVPTNVRVGQTISFSAQLSTPRGARGLDYLRIQVFNPSGASTNVLNLNAANIPGCAVGATLCSASVQFGPVAPPLGTWNVSITVFDQQGQSGGRNVPITVIP